MRNEATQTHENKHYHSVNTLIQPQKLMGTGYRNLQVIQRWPRYDQDGFDPRWKCHGAVFFWLLKELNYSDDAVSKVMNLAQAKYKASMHWIPAALNYEARQRITRVGEIKVGDILFTALFTDSKILPMHSMVCDGMTGDEPTIQGFNNGGTFGGKGDAFGERIPLKLRFVDGKGLVCGLHGEPVYKVGLATAKDSAIKFVDALIGPKDGFKYFRM